MDTPLPHRHDGSTPRRETFAAGKSVPRNGIVTFPASAPIRHDRDPVTDVEFDTEPERPVEQCQYCGCTGRVVYSLAGCEKMHGPKPSRWHDRTGNPIPYEQWHGETYGFPRDARPTPPEDIGPALTTSLIHGALVQWGDGNTELAQVAQVIAGAIRLEAERIAEAETKKLNVVITALMAALAETTEKLASVTVVLERHVSRDNHHAELLEVV